MYTTILVKGNFNMLEAKNLTKVYNPKKGVPVYALNDVSLRLPDTGMVFILGKSGSGKSTLLNVLGGLDKYDSGEIMIKGVSSKTFKQKHFDSYRNTYIGFIFQEYNILDDFSIGANIGLAIELQGRKATSAEINSILETVDLAGMGHRKPNELSGGQKQRVAIARALVKNPQIIMADEPTGALDSKTGKQVFDTLKKLSKDKLVLIVSHDRDFSEQYADRIIELADGKIISDVEFDEQNESYNSHKLEFNNEGVMVPDNYILNESDLQAINNYLEAKRNGATLISAYKKPFKKTDESRIPSQDGAGFKLIKSRLPMHNAIKMGANSLKHKTGRLVFTIFLSVIAFSLFGLATTVASYDHANTVYTSMRDSNISHLSLAKMVTTRPDEMDPLYDKYNTSFTDDDLENISNATGLEFKGAIQHDIRLKSPYLDSSKFAYGSSMFEEIKNVMYMSEADFQKYGFELMGAGARMPESDNEIIITDFYYEAFKTAGYRDPANPADSKISNVDSPDDLIGKEIQAYYYDKTYGFETTVSYEIVGIINTHFDIDRYRDMLFASEDDNNNAAGGGMDMIDSMLKESELSSVLEYTPTGFAFVSEDSFKDIYDAKIVKTNYGNYFNFSLTKNNPFYDGNYNAWTDDYRIFDEKTKITYTVDGVTSLTGGQILLSADVVCRYGSDAMSKAQDDGRLPAMTEEKVLDWYKATYTREHFERNLSSSDYEYLLNEYCNMKGIHEETERESAKSYYKKNQKALYDELWNLKFWQYNLTDSEVKLQYVNQDTGEIALKYTEYFNAVNGSSSYEMALAYMREGFLDGFSDSWYLEHGWNNMTEEEIPKNYFTVVGFFDKGGNMDYNSAIMLSDEFMSQFKMEPSGKYRVIVAPVVEYNDDLLAAIKYANGTYKDGVVRYSIESNVAATLNDVNDLLETLGQVFLYIGIGFAVFASLLMFNFISTSINFKKHDIGILRAIGSRSNDVFRIFFSESFIIACINFLLSAGITVGVTMFLNNYLRTEYGLLITLLTIGIKQIGLIFGVSVGVAFVSSFLPVKKIASKKPIDAIRDR